MLSSLCCPASLRNSSSPESLSGVLVSCGDGLGWHLNSSLNTSSTFNFIHFRFLSTLYGHNNTVGLAGIHLFARLLDLLEHSLVGDGVFGRDVGSLCVEGDVVVFDACGWKM